MKSIQVIPGASGEPPIIADSIALDMLNTGGRDSRGEPREFWRSDADVAQWLLKHNLYTADQLEDAGLDGLAEKAVALREHVRTLVTSRKAGKTADVALLNDYLQKAPGYLQLQWDAAQSPTASRFPADSSPYQLLRPLCEAAVDLIVNGDFALVRQCEHPECVLWFYDRTKGHRRRWCSMAVCGNRYKVARFKKRQSDSDTL